MKFRTLFGEIKGTDVIDIGDKVTIQTLDAEYTGILRKANRTEIIINGETKFRKIRVEDIMEINKS